MGILRRKFPVRRGAEIAVDSLVTPAGGGSRLAAVNSAVALVLSIYSLWESSLKRADLRMFVPPVRQYSAPNQNSNFE